MSASRYECLELWDKVRTVPSNALKRIEAGRLKGKSDINPQWRIQAMTEVFGPCGKGWKYEVEKQWIEEGPVGQVFCFTNVSLQYFLRGDNTTAGWSEKIPGTGGAMLIAKEKDGLYANDEAFKMALTDALSVAMKALGVGADIYLGKWDGSKYKEWPSEENNKKQDVAELLQGHKATMQNTAGLDALQTAFANGYKELGRLGDYVARQELTEEYNRLKKVLEAPQ